MGRRGVVAGMFAALVFTASLVGAFGVLFDATLRAHAPAVRYATATAVVARPQTISMPLRQAGDPPRLQSRPLTERARVPLGLADRLRAEPRVRAVIADVTVPVMVPGVGAVRGHGWDSAPLGPFTLRVGRAPAGPDEVVLELATARSAGVRVGSVVGRYRVVGLASGPEPAAFFTEATALRLSGHPDSADAIAVFADRAVSAPPGYLVATGADRGHVESPETRAAQPDLIQLMISFGSVALMVAMVVLTGLVTLSARLRAREFALLRTVGATPGQLRRTAVREVGTVALPAAILGAALSPLVAALIRTALASAGAVPPGFGLAGDPLPKLAAVLATMLVATGTAWLATLRVSRIKPTRALGESSAEPAVIARGRVITGMIVGLLGLSMLGVASFLNSADAASAIGGLVVLLIIATALLGPLLARLTARVLARPAGLLGRVPGGVAVHNTRASSRRLAAVITPVALAVAFLGTQLFAQATMVDQTQAEARAGTLANFAVVGTGLPPELGHDLAALPGVHITEVKRSTVVLVENSLGDQQLTSVPAEGITPANGTLDPGVTSGRIGGLTGNTVALSSNVTGTFPVGSTITLWLGNGTAIRPKVVARYDRGLAFGDVLLPHDLLAAHTSSPLDDSILVRGGSAAEFAPVLARYAGVRLVGDPGLIGGLSGDVRLQGVANDILVVVIGGFTAIGVITTLALATLGRRREFALLRLVGATRRQVLRMLRWETVLALGTGITVGAAIAGVTLIGFATAVFGRPLPTVPLGTSAAIVVTVAVLGSVAIALPARAVLHRPPAETIGVPE